VLRDPAGKNGTHGAHNQAEILAHSAGRRAPACPQDGQPLGAGGQADYLRTPDQGSRALRETPSSSSSSRTGLQDAYVAPLRTQHGPRVLRRCFGKAKEQVTDLLLLVEVGRLELPCLVIRTLPPHAAAMGESGR
jgi:hypothetical protein